MFIASTAYAKAYTLKSLRQEKDKYHQNLNETLQSRIEAVVPKTHFLLHTDIELKVIYDRPSDKVRPIVYIDKCFALTMVIV